MGALRSMQGTTVPSKRGEVDPHLQTGNLAVDSARNRATVVFGAALPQPEGSP